MRTQLKALGRGAVEILSHVDEEHLERVLIAKYAGIVLTHGIAIAHAPRLSIRARARVVSDLIARHTRARQAG
jgi:hypothetical protein